MMREEPGWIVSFLSSTHGDLRDAARVGLVESDHVTFILASDWSKVITRPGYWPLIGQK